MKSMQMDEYKMALATTESTIRKNKKAYETLSQKEPPRAAQMNTVKRQIEVHEWIASMLRYYLNEGEKPQASREDIQTIFIEIVHYQKRIEQVKLKFKAGTAQHTLASRRLRAYEIAIQYLTEGKCM